MPPDQDTIVAVATPPGRGGVGIVRASGPAVPDLAAALLGALPAPRQAKFSAFRDTDGSVLDTGIALYFPAPASFTGEHVLELQAHGSPVVLDLLLRRLLSLGARLARPGEFSERAFLNDKLDLVQAEAVADLIAASTERAARSAQRSLQGEFSRLIHGLVDALADLRAYVEVTIDFVDEDIDFLEHGQIEQRLCRLLEDLDTIRRSARQGFLLREGLTLVIAGKPNAGKSSLLNWLAGRDAAIVTDIAGTTRDLLRESIQIDGLPLHVVDTAGLRETGDLIEQEGVRRAREAIAQADHILLVQDDRESAETESWPVGLPPDIPLTRIRNKIDLTGTVPGSSDSDGGVVVNVSLKTGVGLDALIQRLKECVGYRNDGEQVFIARRRHLDALEAGRGGVERGLGRLREGDAELLAEELRIAQQALAEITGEFTSEDLLGRIFAGFCIGK